MAPVTRSNNRVVSKSTARQPKLKNVMIQLRVSHNKRCMLCGRKEISEKLYGLLYQFNDVIVHYFCILLSSKAVQKGEDNEGIWGFLLKDIKAELIRGSRESCYYCNKKGATLSCSGVNCQKVFHLPCGLRNQSMHQFFQSFKSFCQEHRIPQIINSSELQKSTPIQCAICKDNIQTSPSPTTIWAPCCKNNSWFHRECIQDLALSAGYFFKCPLCNNVEKFKSTMLTLGIYIPSRDASWETVPNAFAELSERHSICSIETCLCPHEKTRNFQLESGSWEILLCYSCGSNGTHRLCSSIKGDQEWYCEVCKGVADKDALNKKNTQLPLLDNGNCSGTSVIYGVPSHNTGVSQRENSRIMRNRDQPQSSDEPILISDDSIQSISDDEPSSTIDVAPPNTRPQVEQTPQIQLPIITGYGSLRTGVFRNLLTGGYNYIARMGIDLGSLNAGNDDNDDNDDDD